MAATAAFARSAGEADLFVQGAFAGGSLGAAFAAAARDQSAAALPHRIDFAFLDTLLPFWA
jgi:hypothetical protein